MDIVPPLNTTATFFILIPPEVTFKLHKNKYLLYYLTAFAEKKHHI
jgi:hypothetical protein